MSNLVVTRPSPLDSYPSKQLMILVDSIMWAFQDAARATGNAIVETKPLTHFEGQMRVSDSSKSNYTCSPPRHTHLLQSID